VRSQRREIARTDQFGQLGDPAQDPTASLIHTVTPNASRFGSHEKFSRNALFGLFPSGHARLGFLVKKNFSLQLKIKLIFFLSVSQLISNLKPAGEGGNRAHVNKL